MVKLAEKETKSAINEKPKKAWSGDDCNEYKLSKSWVARVRLALKPRFLSKGRASQFVSICVFVAYRVSGHFTQDN